MRFMLRLKESGEFMMPCEIRYTIRRITEKTKAEN